jgi:hypothetical protein
MNQSTDVWGQWLQSIGDALMVLLSFFGDFFRQVFAAFLL